MPERVSKVSDPVTPVAGAKASAVDCVIVPVAMMLTAEPELTAATISAALTLVTPALARSPGRVPVVLVVVILVSIQKTPYVYNYLSLEAQQIPEIKKIYEESLEFDADLGDDLPFSKTNTNQIQGYYDAKNDKVVVIASNTPINEAAKVAIHEVAHRGMVRMAKDLGGTKELNQILLNSEYELMKKLPELLKRTGHESLKSLMLDYGFTTESEEGKVKLLSELAARWAETLVNKPKPSWWKDFLTSIQKWITKFTGKILNEKEVNELVGGFVKYGTKVNQRAKT